VNNGLLPVVYDTRGIREGDRVELEPSAAGLPQIMMDILDAGGLVCYMRRHGDFRL
jgi:3-isopropylmalate/(R)-2-methylmalate dehydratase small subunit